eukprot:GHRQ01000680.1.p1 GENE.GHRQ01000680.1~~GHRQ01000680.1.p1  ORF type:complete len:255 (+),score=21.58 GHRQ01000680.1:327-1091(+)
MSAISIVVLLLLQLATQSAVLASCGTSHAAQQQELVHPVDTSTSPQGRQLTAIRSGFGGRSFGGSSFGGSSRSSTSYRPTGGLIGGSRVAGGARLPGGFGGYGRSGFRSTPFILPLALGTGLIAGSAISSLNRNPSAYCNGMSVQCYKTACEQALRDRCPDAAAESNNTLVLTACPDSRYSECYATPSFNDTATTSFECFGVRRPRYGREDLAAVCHQPDSENGFFSSAGTTSSSKVLGMLLPCVLGVLLLLAV